MVVENELSPVGHAEEVLIWVENYDTLAREALSHQIEQTITETFQMLSDGNTAEAIPAMRGISRLLYRQIGHIDGPKVTDFFKENKK